MIFLFCILATIDINNYGKKNGLSIRYLLWLQGQRKFSLKMSRLVFLNFIAMHWFTDGWQRSVNKVRISRFRGTLEHSGSPFLILQKMLGFLRTFLCLELGIFQSSLVLFSISCGILHEEVIWSMPWSPCQRMEGRSELRAGGGGAGIHHWCQLRF